MDEKKVFIFALSTVVFHGKEIEIVKCNNVQWGSSRTYSMTYNLISNVGLLTMLQILNERNSLERFHSLSAHVTYNFRQSNRISIRAAGGHSKSHFNTFCDFSKRWERESERALPLLPQLPTDYLSRFPYFRVVHGHSLRGEVGISTQLLEVALTKILEFRVPRGSDTHSITLSRIVHLVEYYSKRIMSVLPNGWRQRVREWHGAEWGGLTMTCWESHEKWRGSLPFRFDFERGEKRIDGKRATSRTRSNGTYSWVGGTGGDDTWSRNHVSSYYYSMRGRQFVYVERDWCC